MVAKWRTSTFLQSCGGGAGKVGKVQVLAGLIDYAMYILIMLISSSTKDSCREISCILICDSVVTLLV